MYVNSVSMFCILLSLFYLYCALIALLYSNVRLSQIKDYLLTYLRCGVATENARSPIRCSVRGRKRSSFLESRSDERMRVGMLATNF